MTNQDIVISEGGNSHLTMAIAVAISNTSLFPSTPVKKYSYKRRILKKLETTCKNDARINAFLDSMRASSPTHRASDDDNNNNHEYEQRQNSWTFRHPSALGMWEEIAAAATGKQIAVFLDYDGTLSPIVEDPDRAFMTNEMREALKDVAKLFPTAIVSGRCCSKVHSFVRLSELYYAGSHGMDIKGPSKRHGVNNGSHQSVLCQPAREFLPMIDEVWKCLVEKIKHIPGAKVENNKFCLSVHYRCVEEERWGELADVVKSTVKEYQGLRLNQGRKVLEIRPAIKWDKGNAVEFLLESLGYGDTDNVLPIYIGDDRTDEDAFKVLRKRGQGLGILVSKAARETSALYSLEEPLQVMHFLKRLVAWKKSGCRPY